MDLKITDFTRKKNWEVEFVIEGKVTGMLYEHKDVYIPIKQTGIALHSCDSAISEKKLNVLKKYTDKISLYLKEDRFKNKRITVAEIDDIENAFEPPQRAIDYSFKFKAEQYFKKRPDLSLKTKPYTRSEILDCEGEKKSWSKDAQFLRDFRQQYELTRKQAADLLRCSTAGFTSMEIDQRPVPKIIKTAVELLKVFDLKVPMDFFEQSTQTIKSTRFRIGLTQKELAQALRVTPTTVSNFEKIEYSLDKQKTLVLCLSFIEQLFQNELHGKNKGFSDFLKKKGIKK